MNNISGFSGALMASNPPLASEPKTGGDSAAAPKGQSFETLLTGLSQQSETTTNSSLTAGAFTGQGAMQKSFAEFKCARALEAGHSFPNAADRSGLASSGNGRRATPSHGPQREIVRRVFGCLRCYGSS